ncbi:MAG TPA: YdcF family protein [Vicinamibacteria bacterium]|nr:YdcF family protein [Vicinamibacteria bacterium]
MDKDEAARRVWDYHHVGHALAPADCIVVLGSHDLRVADRGAELLLAGWARHLVFTGGLGSLTRGLWDRPEAEVFADRAAERGVPRDRMLLEPRATNTGENVAFTRELLRARGLPVKKAIAVQKPYMERRTLATFRQLWPELELIVTSPQLDFDAYASDSLSRDDVIHIMVGDLQRLTVYAEKGWSAPQEIPPEVEEAYRRLVKAGYTRRLIAGR